MSTSTSAFTGSGPEHSSPNVDHEPNPHHPTRNSAGTRPSPKAARNEKVFKAGLLLAFLAFAVPITVPTVLYAIIDSWSHSECDHITPFSAGNLLAPDLTFGSFSLVEARAIDLGWNLAMGRLLPFALPWISYRVGVIAVVHIAEKDTVTYEAFASITVEANSVFVIVSVCRDIIHIGSKTSKFIMGALVFSTLYLLALPTLIDVETGYVRNQEKGWQLPQGTIWMLSCYWGTEPSGHCLIDGELASSVCVDGEGYRWGFSWVWFIITHGLMFVWTALMLETWLLATSNSVLLRRGRSMGMWRAVVDLGVAIRRDLGEALDDYSDEELGTCVAQRTLQYFTHLEDDSEHSISLVPAKEKVTLISPSSSISAADTESLEQHRQSPQISGRQSPICIDPTSEANASAITAT